MSLSAQPGTIGEEGINEETHTETTTENGGSGQLNLETSLAIRKAIRSGRGIRRLVTLCGTIRQLVKESDRRLRNLSDSDEDDDDEDSEAPQPPQDPQELARRRDRDWGSFQALVNLVPGFKKNISNPSEPSRMLYYAHLLTGANSARSDDTSSVKPKIAEWLNRPEIPADQHLTLSSRDGRGLQNDITGRLLCPIKYDWDDLKCVPIYDDHITGYWVMLWALYTSVRAKVRDEVDGYSASEDYWIRCLYEGGRGNPEDVEKGFLKGELLVRTFKLIFTSPSSADSNQGMPNNRTRRGKSFGAGPPKRANNAELHGMDGSVTPRAIAYAAVQLHFNLTDATHWMSYYNGFSYEEFYEFVIDFFEADATPEGQEASANLLEWWNKAVFPRSAATRAAEPTSTRRTSLAILRQQRQAARSSHPPS